MSPREKRKMSRDQKKQNGAQPSRRAATTAEHEENRGVHHASGNHPEGAAVKEKSAVKAQAPVFALKGFIKIVIVVLLAIVLINAARYVYRTSYTIFSDKPNLTGEKREYTINVEPGMTIDRIANILYINGIIPNEFNFKIQAKLGGLAKTIEPGEHKLDSYMTSEEIIETLSGAGVVTNE